MSPTMIQPSFLKQGKCARPMTPVMNNVKRAQHSRTIANPPFWRRCPRWWRRSRREWGPRPHAGDVGEWQEVFLIFRDIFFYTTLVVRGTVLGSVIDSPLA